MIFDRDKESNVIVINTAGIELIDSIYTLSLKAKATGVVTNIELSEPLISNDRYDSFNLNINAYKLDSGEYTYTVFNDEIVTNSGVLHVVSSDRKGDEIIFNPGSSSDNDIIFYDGGE